MKRVTLEASLGNCSIERFTSIAINKGTSVIVNIRRDSQEESYNQTASTKDLQAIGAMIQEV